MPRLLKSETNRRLVVSQRSISLAFSLLATPKSVSFEESDTDYAIEMGLIGIAADLAISACLYEVLGVSGIIRKDSGFYLTASEALAAFQTTLSSTIPRLSALTHGVSDPQKHLKKLATACSGFPVIFTARAAAVHGGAGVAHDVAFCAGKSVADFLLMLTESDKWKPYLTQVPKIPALPKEKTLIAQELAASLSVGDKSKAAVSLAGIFLVLPELAEKEPDWLKTLQRVQVTPRSHDISVLIKSLKQAGVGELYKVGKGASAIATKIDPTNPNAIPIFIEGMKKKFDKLSDAWGGYVGTANGQLDKGILSLPPIDAIYAFAATGIENVGLPTEDTASGLSAHSLWPFIAGALDYSGTKGPCFFLIRSLKAGEYGQLSALLDSASSHSNKIAKALKDYRPLFEAVANSRMVNAGSTLANKLHDEVDKREERRGKLEQQLANRIKSAIGKRKTNYETLLGEVKKADSLASPLSLIADGSLDMDSDKYPALRLLIDAASEREDLQALTEILMNNGLQSVSTTTRKAISEIDYAFFGPQIAP